MGIGGFCGKIAWDDHMTVSSTATRADAINTKVNENKENTNKDIQAVIEAFKEFIKDNKSDHEKMMEKLDRISRRN